MSVRRFVSLSLLLLSPVPVSAQTQKLIQEPTRAVRYYNAEWSFDDVDVANLTKRLQPTGIKLPVHLRGRISGKLSVGIPWGALRDPLAWRLDGALTSGLLSIDDWTVHDLSAEIAYRTGVLSLNRFRLFVPVDSINVASRANTRESGELRGTARMDLRPGGLFTANLDVRELPLRAMAEPFEALRPGGGVVSGNLQARVPVNRMRNSSAWQVIGPVSAKNLSLRSLPPVNGDLQFELKDNKASVIQLNAESGPLRLSGDGDVKLSGDGTWTALVQLDADELTDVQTQVAGLIPEQLREFFQENVRGKVQVTTKVKGTLIPFSITGSGHFLATDLQIRLDSPTVPPGSNPHYLRFSRIETDYDVNTTRLKLTKLNAEGSDLNASGDATLVFDDAFSWEFDGELNSEQIDHARASLSPVFLPGWSDIVAAMDGSITMSARVRGTSTPFSVTGTGSLRGEDASIRLQDRYANAIGLKPLRIQTLTTDFELDAQMFRLRNATADLAEGRLEAGLDLPLNIAQRNVSVDLTWNELAPGQILERWVSDARTSSGEIHFSAPLANIVDRRQWTANGALTVDRLDVASVSLRDFEISEMRLQDGSLSSDKIQAGVGNTTVRADGNIRITAPWDLSVHITSPQLELSRLATLPQLATFGNRLDGSVSFDGSMQGTLSPLELGGSGSMNGKNIRFDDYVAEDFDAQWSLERDAVRISKMAAHVFSGKVGGTAELPLSQDSPAKMDLAITAIETAEITKRMDLPVEIGGLVSGEVHLTAEPGDVANPVAWTMAINLQAPNLQLNKLAIGQVNAQIEQKQQRLTCQATGKLFDGLVEVTGERRSPFRKQSDSSQATEQNSDESSVGSAEAVLTGADVRTILALINNDPAVPPVTGRLDLKLSLNETSTNLNWDGTIALSRATVGKVELSDGLRGKISGSGSRIQLDDLQGTLAGGRLAASIVADPGKRNELDARVSLRSVRLERLKLLDSRTRDLPVSGFADLELKGQSGHTWHLQGLVTTGRGSFDKVQFDRLRIPVTVHWTPDGGRLRGRSSSATISIAGGTVAGKFTFDLTSRLQVSGDGRFRNLQLSQLSRAVSSRPSNRRGRIDGTFTLSGRNARSVNDLTAEVRSEFRDTQAFSLPVLRGLPGLVPGASSATSFRHGEFNGRLKNGVVDIQRLSLASSRVSLYVTGKYTLNGRLRLDAVVSTGSQEDLAFTQLFVTRLLAATPVGWLLIANDYLANRTIHIGIEGTPQQPILRIKPVESLQEEAVSFFLRQTLGVQAPRPAAP